MKSLLTTIIVIGLSFSFAVGAADQKYSLASDPIQKLIEAYASASPSCRSGYQSAYLDAMKDIKTAKRIAETSPEDGKRLESEARNRVSTLLSMMRSNNCAPKE